MFLGGGFGGNGGGGTGVTRQAAEISKQIGKPVKVIWSREEDLAQDKQRPLAVAKLSAAIGDDGLPTALFTRAAWASMDGINQLGSATADYGIYNMPYKISASSARAAQREDFTSRARRIAPPAPTSSASWPRSSSTRWRSRADGIRSNGASR